jgi:hypothetical protein
MEETTKLSTNIITTLDKTYRKFIKNECMDILQLKNICNLFKNKTNKANEEIPLSDINLSSPTFVNEKTTTKKTQKSAKSKPTPSSQLTQEEILTSVDFRKRYDFFIRVVYSCLKMDVDIFDIEDDVATLKNNYKLLKSLEMSKKKLIEEHYGLLKAQFKNLGEKLDPEYETYVRTYITKIKIIDKISGSIQKLFESGVFAKTDNLFSLILPFFYSYAEYIEEYN